MHPGIDSTGTPAPQDLTRVGVPGGPRLNALKHGRRSAAVLLPGDDADEFQRMRRELYDLYRPGTGQEARCVNAMADHEWCMERCRRWRQIYHARLDALLHGEPDGSGGVHCERDPHRWHHSAMDCALEEGRLGRLQDRERRKLVELRKLRSQNLLAGLVQAAEREAGVWPEPGADAGPRGTDLDRVVPAGADTRPNSPEPGQHAPSEMPAAPATPLYDGRNGKNPERNQLLLSAKDAQPTAPDRGKVELPGGDDRPAAPERWERRTPDVRPVELPPNFKLRERGRIGCTAVSSG